MWLRRTGREVRHPLAAKYEPSGNAMVADWHLSSHRSVHSEWNCATASLSLSNKESVAVLRSNEPSSDQYLLCRVFERRNPGSISQCGMCASERDEALAELLLQRATRTHVFSLSSMSDGCCSVKEDCVYRIRILRLPIIDVASSIHICSRSMHIS